MRAKLIFFLFTLHSILGLEDADSSLALRTLDISLRKRRIRNKASNKFMSHGTHLSRGDFLSGGDFQHHENPRMKRPGPGANAILIISFSRSASAKVLLRRGLP